jgi:hypothetical protein
MSCVIETSAPTVVGPARPHIREREIHRMSVRDHDTARPGPVHAVADSSKPDPEHIWGDEGPVNE